MLAKAIKEYDISKGYTFGVKVTSEQFKSLLNKADESFVTVNEILNRIVSMGSRNLSIKDMVSLVRPGEMKHVPVKHRVKLSKENFLFLEQVRAEVLGCTGVMLRHSEVLSLILICLSREQSAAQSNKAKGARPVPKVKKPDHEELKRADGHRVIHVGPEETDKLEE